MLKSERVPAKAYAQTMRPKSEESREAKKYENKGPQRLVTDVTPQRSNLQYCTRL